MQWKVITRLVNTEAVDIIVSLVSLVWKYTSTLFKSCVYREPRKAPGSMPLSDSGFRGRGGEERSAYFYRRESTRSSSSDSSHRQTQQANTGWQDGGEVISGDYAHRALMTNNNGTRGFPSLPSARCRTGRACLNSSCLLVWKDKTKNNHSGFLVEFRGKTAVLNVYCHKKFFNL